jgi:hypothetical protein
MFNLFIEGKDFVTIAKTEIPGRKNQTFSPKSW